VVKARNVLHARLINWECPSIPPYVSENSSIEKYCRDNSPRVARSYIQKYMYVDVPNNYEQAVRMALF
jgi:hypothetical protein